MQMSLKGWPPNDTIKNSNEEIAKVLDPELTEDEQKELLKPLTDKELEEKFRDCIGGFWSHQKKEEVIRTIGELALRPKLFPKIFDEFGRSCQVQSGFRCRVSGFRNDPDQ